MSDYESFKNLVRKDLYEIFKYENKSGFAKAIGIDRSNFHNMLKGKKGSFSLDRLLTIASMVGLKYKIERIK